VSSREQVAQKVPDGDGMKAMVTFVTDDGQDIGATGTGEDLAGAPDGNWFMANKGVIDTASRSLSQQAEAAWRRFDEDDMLRRISRL
jgi:hypothetical protein